MAHNEPPHLDLHCWQTQLLSGFGTFSVNTGMMGLFKRHIYKIIQNWSIRHIFLFVQYRLLEESSIMIEVRC